MLHRLRRMFVRRRPREPSRMRWACVNPACEGNNPFETRRCPLGRKTCPLDLVAAGNSADEDRRGAPAPSGDAS